MGQSTTATAVPTTLPALDPWLAQLHRQVQHCRQRFRQAPLTPQAAATLEQDLHAAFQDAGRTLLQQEFNDAEPDVRAQTPPKLRYRRQSYRINKKTQATVATTFGPLTLWSWLYLADEPGEPGLQPLHLHLGLQAGAASTVLAERVAAWAVEHSQRAVRQRLQAEHGVSWSKDRLRAVLRTWRRAVVAFRAEAQCQRLLAWLTQAERSRGRHRPVLAAGRDGVMVPIRGHGYKEASTATVSIYNRRGQRLGTVYLGQLPEKHQATLSQELTALLMAVLSQYSGPLPRLVYVTDKGQAPDDYYRRVLRRMAHPRQPQQRLAWEWVLDFYHVCSYLSQLAEALFGRRRPSWLGRMRHWLRWRRQGVTQILRSALQHYPRRQLSQAAEQAFWKAYRYLRRHSRWMHYGRYARLGLPLGSGVTEAACKTVFSQRLKGSGMRWDKESGQVIVDLRVLHLSGIWDEVVQRMRQSQPLPEKVSYQPRLPRNRHKAA